jgi:hypothetical protein
MTPSQYPQEGNIRPGAELSNHDKGGYSRDSQCEQCLPRRIFPSPVVFCHAPTPNSPVSHHARSVQHRLLGNAIHLRNEPFPRVVPYHCLACQNTAQCTTLDDITVPRLQYFHSGSEASQPVLHGGRFMLQESWAWAVSVKKLRVNEAGAAVHSGAWCLHHGSRDHGFVAFISRVSVEGSDGLHQLR